MQWWIKAGLDVGARTAMNVILVWVLIGAGSSIVCWLAVFRFVSSGERAMLAIVFLALSSLGATCGVLGGLSRESAVGSIIAAALGFLGGVVVYLFAVDRSRGTIVSICTICFSTSLFFGYFAGSSLRYKPESYAFWRETCVVKLTDKELMGDAMMGTIIDQSFGKICAQIFNTERQSLTSD